jgi:catechol 2,3-dioxygenase-like lactoylglutathione lyase family enzyme
MAEHATPATCGIDHVGLSVRDLENTRRFFCDARGGESSASGRNIRLGRPPPPSI